VTFLVPAVAGVIALALLAYIAVKPLLHDRQTTNPADPEDTAVLPAPKYTPRHSRTNGSAR